MALVLYFHPLASFCHKVLIALYENARPFEGRLVDLMDEADKARYRQMWPVGKMPVLTDSVGDQVVPETSIIIEYLDQHYPGDAPLLPADPALKLEARLWDRFFDLYIHASMQKIVADVIRPADAPRDPYGVAEARTMLQTGYAMLEQRMAGRTWAVGDTFSLADCAAAPALFYADTLEPFQPTCPNLAAYFNRLLERPSFKRVLDEARPYFRMYPFHDLLPPQYRDVTRAGG